MTATTAGLDLDTLKLMLEALGDFVAAELPESRILELDHEDLCPEDTVRAMCGDALGVQLVFIPEEYGGLGGGAFDSYRVCERMARVRHRPGHLGVRHVPRQRPDPRGRHGGAEEGVARPDRRAGHRLRVRRHRARGRAATWAR